jgi:hypothetical protein
MVLVATSKGFIREMINKQTKTDEVRDKTINTDESKGNDKQANKN